MATWNEFAGKGRPPLRSERPRAPNSNPAPTPGASSSKIAPPKTLNQWERNVTRLRSAQWPGLTIRFGKDRSFAEGFAIKVDDSRLSLLDYAITNPHNLVYSTNFFLNPTNGSVEVKEILSTRSESPIMVLSQTASVKAGDFTAIKSDNREGENPSANFYIRILLKPDVQFRVTPRKENDEIDPGEQAQAMFLSRFRYSMRGLIYLGVCIPNYRSNVDRQGVPFFKESEVQRVLHRQNLQDAKSNGEALCTAARHSLDVADEAKDSDYNLRNKQVKRCSASTDFPSMEASRHVLPQPTPAPILATSESPQQLSAGSSLYASKYASPAPASAPAPTPIPTPTSTPILARARTDLTINYTETPEPDRSTDSKLATGWDLGDGYGALLVWSKMRVVEENILRVIATGSNMERASVSIDRLEHHLERSFERVGATRGGVLFASCVISEVVRLAKEENPLPAQLVDLFVEMAGLRVQQKEEQRDSNSERIDWSLIPQ